MRTETEALLGIANAKIQDLQAKLDNEKENFRVFNFDYEKMKSKLAAKDALLDDLKSLSLKICSQQYENYSLQNKLSCALSYAKEIIDKIQEARNKL